MEIEYLGLKIKPIGNIIGGKYFHKLVKFATTAYEIRHPNYNYRDFYKIAKKQQCSCDVYEIDGKLYIPCNHGFEGLVDNVTKHMRFCKDYDKWYKWSR